MAEHRPVATGEHSGHLAGVARRDQTDEIDTAKDPLYPPSLQAAINRPRRQAELDELAARYDSVLPAGEASNTALRRPGKSALDGPPPTSAHLTTHIDANPALAPSALASA